MRTAFAVIALFAALSCSSSSDSNEPEAASSSAEAPGSEAEKEDAGPGGAPAAAREALVAQLERRGIEDAATLDAIRQVPRHELVPERLRDVAYADRPLPIGHEQTISQPFIVAKMTELADLDEDDRVLEVGTGSGYQAAVLAEVAGEVYSVEIVAELATRARADLDRLGYDAIRIREGDGYRGWPEHAPFDAIVVTAAPTEVPEPLIRQLRVGGVMVIPVGAARQTLRVLERKEEGVEPRDVFDVRFVPMTGRARSGEEGSE